MPTNTFELTAADREQIDKKLREISGRAEKKWAITMGGRGTSAISPNFHVALDGNHLDTIHVTNWDRVAQQVCDELDRLSA